MAGQMHYVYILKSLKDQNYYVGLSADVEKRLQAHNAGKVRSTKQRRPFKLIHSQQFETLRAAREREKFLKSYEGVREKRAIIQRCDN
jgi:putative endonuclease